MTEFDLSDFKDGQFAKFVAETQSFVGAEVVIPTAKYLNPSWIKTLHVTKITGLVPLIERIAGRTPSSTTIVHVGGGGGDDSDDFELPDQASNDGRCLETDGTNVSWSSAFRTHSGFTTFSTSLTTTHSGNNFLTVASSSSDAVVGISFSIGEIHNTSMEWDGTQLILSAKLRIDADLTITGDTFLANVDADVISGTELQVDTPVSIEFGGTGADNADDAINNLLPDQTDHTGEALFTDGTNTFWASIAAGTDSTDGGTVSSIWLFPGVETNGLGLWSNIGEWTWFEHDKGQIVQEAGNDGIMITDPAIGTGGDALKYLYRPIANPNNFDLQTFMYMPHAIDGDFVLGIFGVVDTNSGGTRHVFWTIMHRSTGTVPAICLMRFGNHTTYNSDQYGRFSWTNQQPLGFRIKYNGTDSTFYTSNDGGANWVLRFTMSGVNPLGQGGSGLSSNFAFLGLDVTSGSALDSSVVFTSFVDKIEHP